MWEQLYWVLVIVRVVLLFFGGLEFAILAPSAHHFCGRLLQCVECRLLRRHLSCLAVSTQHAISIKLLEWRGCVAMRLRREDDGICLGERAERLS